MEPSLFQASLQGLFNIMNFEIWSAMLVGVGIGTIVAVTPQGFGTPLAYALLLPIVIKWEPLTGIGLLIGVSAVSAICAAYLPVLFGIPGGAGSQATVLDGYPMGRKGEARRALGASFMAGGMGALIGTITLAICIPIAQPLIYLLGSPELTIIIFWGLTMIAVLAGREPLKGVIAAAVGLLLSTVGQQSQSGIMRYVFDQIYLLDGFTLSIVALAIFGIPASLNLARTKMGVEVESAPLKGSLLDGMKDTLREWWLVLRCSGVGVWVGLVPGIGAQTVDWLKTVLRECPNDVAKRLTALPKAASGWDAVVGSWAGLEIVVTAARIHVFAREPADGLVRSLRAFGWCFIGLVSIPSRAPRICRLCRTRC